MSKPTKPLNKTHRCDDKSLLERSKSSTIRFPISSACLKPSMNRITLAISIGSGCFITIGLKSDCKFAGS